MAFLRDVGRAIYRDFYWNYNVFGRDIKLDSRFFFRDFFDFVREFDFYWNYNNFSGCVKLDFCDFDQYGNYRNVDKCHLYSRVVNFLGGAGHDLSDDKLAEVKIEAYDDKTLDQCLAICESQSDCATLAYNPTRNKCETWKGTLEQIGVDNTPRAEWYYYSTSCLANDRKDTCARPGWGLDGDLNTSGTKIGKFDGFDNYASCYAICKETEGCAMFAFNPVEQLCELWSGSFEQAGFGPVFRASWTFYRLDCLEPRGGEGGAN
ncbi:hypothetical protein BHE90_013959 [Fusarium euwallaceae]|uniref:Apple domain-containing protein n=1 Tax=Fusarium euwallaceae TaxID=1147111 RepID=A0A430L7B2_9HYPO|nr:hypothetical protein BHE90_013959 [Fusarium euwallaceae]